MKTVLVYYSYTGNTHRVGQLIRSYLENKGEQIIPVRIRPLKEENNMLVQCFQALTGKQPSLYRTLLDVGEFDRIIIGSPVWCGRPAPAINSYCFSCGPLNNKEVVCFTVASREGGGRHAAGALSSALEKKGGKLTGTLLFSQNESEESCSRKIAKVFSAQS